MRISIFVFFVCACFSTRVCAQEPIGFGVIPEEASVQVKSVDENLKKTRKPEEFVVVNFDTHQPNRLQGRGRVEMEKVRAEATALQLDVSLVDSTVPLGKKMAQLVYNAEHGRVRYRIGFKKKRSVQRYNAVGFFLKGDPSRITWQLHEGDSQYSFKFSGLSDEMTEYIIPFRCFSDFPLRVPPLDAISLVITGDEQADEQVAGVVYIENVTLYRFHNDDLPVAEKNAKKYEYVEE